MPDPTYEHLVVPICPEISDKDSASLASGIAAKIINARTAEGWEFVQLTSMETMIKPGCIGMLLGRSSELVAFSVAVFRRPREERAVRKF